MATKIKLKWFTLIEMLIVIVIIWILAVVLTESYLTISKVALRVEQQKNISEESLVLTQIFQAISDEATINYNEYHGSLEWTKWITSDLYLTWWVWSWTHIYTTPGCLKLTEHQELENGNKRIQDYTWCELILDQNWKTTTLTSQWKVAISEAVFKIIPYDSDENYFNNAHEWDLLINNLHQPAFWMFIHLYSPMYQPEWINKIDQPLQLFFNLNL